MQIRNRENDNMITIKKQSNFLYGSRCATIVLKSEEKEQFKKPKTKITESVIFSSCFIRFFSLRVINFSLPVLTSIVFNSMQIYYYKLVAVFIFCKAKTNRLCFCRRNERLLIFYKPFVLQSHSVEFR